jgi:hypothetical protein
MCQNLPGNFVDFIEECSVPNILDVIFVDRLICRLARKISDSLNRLETESQLQTIPLSYFLAIISGLWNGRQIADLSQPLQVAPFPPEDLKNLSRNEKMNVLLISFSGFVPLIASRGQRTVKSVIFAALLEPELLLRSFTVVDMAKEIVELIGASCC